MTGHGYPQFFIVGAPKCGTTALQHQLAQAPDVFMPARKEIHHFADDLLHPDDEMLDADRYLACFADARPGQRIGEASVFHLLSRNAPRNIAAVVPDARILVMVRNPLEVIPSLHSQLVYNGDEPLADLADSLDAEAERRSGIGVPRGLRFEQRLWYSEVIRFAEQIARYRAVFEHVHVVVHDDFKAEPLRVVAEALEFVGADRGFVPQRRIVNANRRVRSARLQSWLRRGALLPSIARALPPALRRAAGRAFMAWNVVEAPRPAPSPDLRLRLRTLCEPEVGRLEAALARDLRHWLR